MSETPEEQSSVTTRIDLQEGEKLKAKHMEMFGIEELKEKVLDEPSSSDHVDLQPKVFIIHMQTPISSLTKEEYEVLANLKIDEPVARRRLLEEWNRLGKDFGKLGRHFACPAFHLQSAMSEQLSICELLRTDCDEKMEGMRRSGDTTLISINNAWELLRKSLTEPLPDCNSSFLRYLEMTLHELDFVHHIIYRWLGYTSVYRKKEASFRYQETWRAIDNLKDRSKPLSGEHIELYLSPVEKEALRNKTELYAHCFSSYRNLRRIVANFRKQFYPEGIGFELVVALNEGESDLESIQTLREIPAEGEERTYKKLSDYPYELYDRGEAELQLKIKKPILRPSEICVGSYIESDQIPMYDRAAAGVSDTRQEPQEQPQVAMALSDVPQEQPQVAMALSDVPQEQPQVAMALSDVPQEQPQVAMALSDVPQEQPQVAMAPVDRSPRKFAQARTSAERKKLMKEAKMKEEFMQPSDEFRDLFDRFVPPVMQVLDRMGVGPFAYYKKTILNLVNYEWKLIRMDCTHRLKNDTGTEDTNENRMKLDHDEMKKLKTKIFDKMVDFQRFVLDYFNNFPSDCFTYTMHYIVATVQNLDPANYDMYEKDGKTNIGHRHTARKFNEMVRRLANEAWDEDSYRPSTGYVSRELGIPYKQFFYNEKLRIQGHLYSSFLDAYESLIQAVREFRCKFYSKGLVIPQ